MITSCNVLELDGFPPIPTARPTAHRRSFCVSFLKARMGEESWRKMNGRWICCACIQLWGHLKWAKERKTRKHKARRQPRTPAHFSSNLVSEAATGLTVCVCGGSYGGFGWCLTMFNHGSDYVHRSMYDNTNTPTLQYSYISGGIM